MRDARSGARARIVGRIFPPRPRRCGRRAERRNGLVVRSHPYGPLAQLVAHLHDAQGVTGSSPVRPTRTTRVMERMSTFVDNPVGAVPEFVQQPVRKETQTEVWVQPKMASTCAIADRTIRARRPTRFGTPPEPLRRRCAPVWRHTCCGAPTADSGRTTLGFPHALTTAGTLKFADSPTALRFVATASLSVPAGSRET